MRRRRAKTPRCDESVVLGQRVPRDRAKVATARRHLKAAVKLFKPSGPMTARQRSAAGWVAALDERAQPQSDVLGRAERFR